MDENTEDQLVKTQTSFQKHLAECSKGLYARIAAKLQKENDILRRQLADLKSQIHENWQ